MGGDVQQLVLATANTLHLEIRQERRHGGPPGLAFTQAAGIVFLLGWTLILYKKRKFSRYPGGLIAHRPRPQRLQGKAVLPPRGEALGPPKLNSPQSHSSE